MKQRCLLLLSLFLATLTGAWAQAVVSDVREVDGDVPCAAPAATRNITINYDITVATVGPNCIMAITNADGSIVYGSTVLSGAQLDPGLNKTVVVAVAGQLTDPPIGQGRVARFRRDPGGTSNYLDYTANGSAPVSPSFDILITPNVSGATPDPVCEGSTMGVTINGTNLNLYGAYTVNYTLFAGFVPITTQSTTATTVNGSTLTFTTVPVTLATTGLVINSLTAANSPNCGPFGLPTVDFPVIVRQLPTISGATTPTPVCFGQDVPVTLQGLIGSGGGFGQQTITYTINGGAPITSPAFTVPGTGPGQSTIVNIPGVPVGGTIVISAISNVGPPACPRLTPPLPITLTPTVHPLPTLTLGTLPTPLCAGTTTITIPITLTGAGNLTISDLQGNSTVASVVFGTLPATAGANTLVVTLSDVTAGLKHVDFLVTDGNGCVTNPRINVDITLNPNPTGTITANPTFCAPGQGAQTAAVVVTAVSGAQPYTTNWSASAATLAPVAGTAGAIATTGGTESRDASTAGGVNVVLTDNNGCTVTLTETVRSLEVTTNTLTIGTAAGCTPFNPGNINGSTPAVVLSSGPPPAPAGPAYTWERTGANDLTFVAIAPITEDHNPAALPANISAIDEVYQYRRIVKYTLGGTTCTSTSAPLNITVWPKATIAAKGPGTGAPFVICSASAATYDPANPIAVGDVIPVGTKYRWTPQANMNVTGQTTVTAGNEVAVFNSGTLVNSTTIAQDVIFDVTAVTVNGCTSTFTITVRVNPKPVITTVSALPPTICASQTATLTFNLAGIPGVNHSITYSQTAGLPAVTNPVSPLSPVVPGNFSFTSTPPSGDPLVQTTMTYTIGSVTYDANGITCAYTLNAPSLSYTLEPEPPIPFGAGGAGSNIVIKDPITNKSEVCEGTGTVAITNDATCGAGFTTKWYVDNTTPFAAGSGLASAPATINTTTGAAMHPSQPTVLSPGTITWYVACRNEITGCETPPAKRKAVSFTVTPAPARPASAAAIGLNPNQICEGAPTPSVAMTNTADAACVAVNAAGFTAVWYDNMGVMLPPSGAAPTMTPTTTTTWQVRCKNPVTGCISLTARNVTFTVNPAPVPPFVIPLAAETDPTFYPSQACQGPAGSRVNLDPTVLLQVPNTVPFNIGCGLNRTLRWYKADGVTLFEGGASPTSLPTDVAGLQTYRVSCINNTTGCESLTKTTITFMVNPAPLAPAPIALSPMTACASTPAGAPMTNTATCTGSTPGGESPVWYDNSGVPLAGAPAVTPAATTTYQVRCKNTTTNCVSLTFTTVTFTVFPTPTIDAIVPATAKYCNGATTMTVALSGTPATAVAPNSAVKFKYTGGASIGLADGTTSTALPSFTATNAGNAPVVVPIIITPYTYGPNGVDDGGMGDDCIGAPFTYTITVNPTPTVNAIPSQVICNNTNNTAVSFGSNVVGTTYKYTVAYSGASMGTPFVDTDPATGVPSLTLTNASTSALAIATITVTPTFDGCTGPTTSFTITVMPALTTNLVASQTDVCPNTEVTLNPNCSTIYPGSPFTTTVQWSSSDPSSPAGPTVTPNAPDLTYTYTAKCIATYMGTTCESASSSSVSVRTHRLLIDIVKVAHPSGDVNQPGSIVEVRNDLGNDLSIPKNTIVSNDGLTPRTWNILAKPCYAPVGSISFEFLAGPLPLNFKTVDNFAPHAFFANDGANAFYSQASPTYGPGGVLPFYTGGTPNFPNGVYTVLVQGRTNAVPGPIPAARNKLSGGALLSTRTVTFEVKGSNPGGARIGVEEEVDTENWISLVQNPISEEIMLRISGKVGDDIQLNLVNLQGQEVHQSSVKLASRSELSTINVRSFNTGFYILKAVNGAKVKTIKVLKVQE